MRITVVRRSRTVRTPTVTVTRTVTRGTVTHTVDGRVTASKVHSVIVKMESRYPVR